MIKPNQCTIPKQQVETCGVKVATVWDVGADETYDISIEKSRRDSHVLSEISGEGSIVIRTLEGRGRIHTSSGEKLEIEGGSLLLINYRHIVRYHTVGSCWRFRWFEIYSKEPLHIPEGTVHPCPVTESEASDFQELIAYLSLNDIQHIRLATSKFINMLYSWWSTDIIKQEGAESYSRMVKAITLVNEDLSKNITVEQMAEAAGMSTTGFRKAFRRFTGQTPKVFCNELRLWTARELLRKNLCNVTQAAAQTGFCDAFHFSRSFTRHFGIPPSQVKRNKLIRS